MMIDSVYQILERMGYSHPIHIAMAHIPIGLMVGAFLFGFWGRLVHRSNLAPIARYCSILGFIFFFPTALLGYMDWQHYYGGDWLFPIKVKFIFSGALLVFLSIGVIISRGRETLTKSDLTIYTLCIVTATVIGFYGSQLEFGGTNPITPHEFLAGEKQFKAHCQSCHPNGSNIINPSLPLEGAPQLASFDTFLAFIRDPERPDRSKGSMPAYAKAEISDQQATQLYRYIINVLEHK